ncbi:MAG: ABC transporter permease, partial [Bryobacteraceae bacterium]
MHGIWRDVRYALRGIGNQPSFALLAILTLALGIGATTTIFSVIDNVLLNPFPYTDAGRIVSFEIHDITSSRPGGQSFFKVPEFLEFQRQNHVFSDSIGGGNEDVLYTSGEGTERFDGAYVTPNTFSFLGVSALLGRTLTPDDAKAGAPPVFVLDYRAWHKSFNADPGILGRVFVLNGIPTTLVGIMPPRFTKRGADLWRPVALDPKDTRYFLLQARMKPGITLRQVEADIDVIAHRLARDYPKDFPKQFNVHADTYVDSLVGHF